MSAKTQVTRSLKIRPGEGAAQVDVHFGPTETHMPGVTRTKAQISIDSLPVPNRRYSADVAFVEMIADTVLICFAQKKLLDQGVRSLVVIKMDPSWAKRFLQTVDEAETPFDKYASDNMIGIEALDTIAEEPKDTVAFDANFVLAAISERQGCMDFFYSSPFAFSASLGAKKLAVDPVLRVDLRGGLMMGIIHKLRNVVGDVGSDEEPEQTL